MIGERQPRDSYDDGEKELVLTVHCGRGRDCRAACGVCCLGGIIFVLGVRSVLIFLYACVIEEIEKYLRKKRESEDSDHDLQTQLISTNKNLSSGLAEASNYHDKLVVEYENSSSLQFS